ncbi:MAG: hypothetical protein JWL77_3668 [Chthonomonadaceae bacterium]|nr:hypothetical protein [Chthonomonadaceae bacterium]
MQFEEWIRFIFLQPIGEPADESEWEIFATARPDLKPGTSVAYLTQLFEHADVLLQSFSNAQVKEGLDLVIANDIFALRDEAVPLAERLRAIQAIQTLFANCFARRCSPHLFHSMESDLDPLNVTCYMWWDVLPIHGLVRHHPARSDSAAIDRTCLDVLKGILEIDSPACQESALNGLHIWSLYYPVKTIIDDFLERHADLRPELRQYAMTAREGW